MKNQSIQRQSFSALSIPAPLLRALEDTNYTEATCIQSAAIPLLLEGQDVIGYSSTGTGKTAAFGIPSVACVDGARKHPQVLVLSPTRELALQITTELQKFAKYKEGICIATLYGGASMGDQIRQLKRANIVVGTPGRLMDHMRRRTLKLDEIKMAVLDEADEMLSMGFVEDIQCILSETPEQRQTVLFSATMSAPILKIAREFLKNPQTVDVITGQDSQADIRQTYYYVSQHDKQAALTLLLRHSDAQRAIVFCNTKSMVDELTTSLRKQGFSAAGLHGDMNQAVRTQVMTRFRTGGTGILIATDVAARGIDVDDVDTVINFDLPQSFEYYVHRIGRTGRAGKQGLSQTLVCNGKQVSVLRALMRFTGKEIVKQSLPTSADLMNHAVEKTAAALTGTVRKPTGTAAKMLVDQLLCADGGAATAYEVACTLAEKLLGGDKAFQSVPTKEEPARHSTPGQDNKSPMVTVIASIGRNDHITPNHLVGTLAELLDIPGRSIGKIDIHEDSSSIGMREDCAKALMDHSPVRIKGTEVTFTVRKSARRAPSPAYRRFSGNTKAGKRNQSA